jgi:hypothetical protein
MNSLQQRHEVRLRGLHAITTRSCAASREIRRRGLARFAGLPVIVMGDAD